MCTDFLQVAYSYDQYSAMATLGIHRLLKRKMVGKYLDLPHGIHVLDVTGGTGK